MIHGSWHGSRRRLICMPIVALSLADSYFNSQRIDFKSELRIRHAQTIIR